MKLLILEFDHLQSIIARFDGQRSTVRAWMITSVTALSALSVQQQSLRLLVLALPLTILFGTLEAVYLSLEATAIERSNRVERFLEEQRRNPDAVPSGYSFGFGESFVRHKFSLSKTIGMIRNRAHFAFFYAVVFAASVAGALLVLML